MKENGYRPGHRTAPGEALAEWMLANNKSADQVSILTGISRRGIRDILAGKRKITESIAHRLAILGHMTADEWMDLQERK